METNILVANQILRIVSEKISNEKDRLAPDEIDIDEVAKLFTRKWLQQNAIGEDAKGILIYSWINWAVWNSKNSKITSYLGEKDIIEVSVHHIGIQHKLWGELWQKLWSCEPLNKHLLQSANKWLPNITAQG